MSIWGEDCDRCIILGHVGAVLYRTDQLLSRVRQVPATQQDIPLVKVMQGFARQGNSPAGLSRVLSPCLDRQDH
jgi:hypothetical protein